MVSLIRLILELFFPRRVIKYWRMPGNNPLRSHLLGLTVAFVVLLIFQVIVVFNFDYLDAIGDWSINVDVENLNAGNSLWGVLIIIIWFGLVTYYFGIWALLTLVLLLFFGLQDREISLWTQFDPSARVYLAGYLFGAILGTLYNDVKYLYIYIFRKNERKLMFAYDSKCMLNVIKSPFDDEMPSAADIPKDRRLYNFKFKTSLPEDRHLFTIAFVANPRYLSKTGQPAKKDPIMRNVYFFLRTVTRALESFHNDPVLGRPEIWSRVRIITIFDEKIGSGINGAAQAPNGFVQAPRITNSLMGEESQESGNLEVDDMVTLTNSSPFDTDIDKVLEDELNNISQPPIQQPIRFKDIDVLFFLSAIPHNLRSTAQFSSDDVDQETKLCIDNTEPENFYNFFPVDKTSVPQKEFERRAKYPGKVALCILGAVQKTFIHEFAHAMSHACNGAIVDEYFDEGLILYRESPPPPSRGTQFDMFAVNRINKPGPINDRVPKKYADYHNNLDQPFTYFSDRDHPSAEEYWSGCYPERQSADIYCTMDRSYGRYQFDKLISDYMYDRLIHKIYEKENSDVAS